MRKAVDFEKCQTYEELDDDAPDGINFLLKKYLNLIKNLVIGLQLTWRIIISQIH